MKKLPILFLLLLSTPPRLYAGKLILAAGGTLSVALAEDGRVYQWGEGSSLTPTSLMGLDNVKAVAAGDRHVLVLRNDGTVWAWGDNSYGQLGDSTAINRNIPVQVRGLSGVKAIACGTFHSYALREDGTLWAWGDNRNGQLGDGTKNDRRSPVSVENFVGIQAIAAGSTHLLALRTDGTVCSWGLAEEDPLYLTQMRMAAGKPVPYCLKEFSGVKAIAAAGGASYALREDGTVWSWGAPTCDSEGGSLSKLSSRRPILDRVDQISAGLFQVLMVRDNQTVWACGATRPQIGQRQLNEIRELNQIESVSAGYRHALARSSQGILWSWGDNTYGQLGTGDRTSREIPGTVWDGTGELSKP